MNARDEREAAHAAHVDVADYEVESGVSKRSQRFFCRARVGTLVGIAQYVDQQISDLFFIVDDENLWLLGFNYFHCLKSLAHSRHPRLAQHAFVATFHLRKIPGFSLPD